MPVSAVSTQGADLQHVEAAIRLLNLIEGAADNLSCLEALEAIDVRRCAIRDAAIDARRSLYLAFPELRWLPQPGGPTRRDGTPLASLPGHRSRFAARRRAARRRSPARKAVLS